VQKYPAVERGRPGTSRAFTLIEIIIAVAILTVILLMAVPSLEGVFADRKLRASLDGFNKLVREAQERSVAEHRAYLIVWGEKDLLISVRDAEAFERLIPNSRRVVYPDTGHVAMLERPAAFNALLAQFLAE